MSDAPSRLPTPEELSRTFIYERLNFIIVGAEIAQRYLETGDDVGLEYQLKSMVRYLRKATESYIELATFENEKQGGGR